MAKTEPFDRYTDKYEQWFTDHKYAFHSELEIIRKMLPVKGKGVEIGVGSGIFASPLGISEGCDPSEEMRRKAAEKGIKAIDAVAENLPWEDGSFDYALMVTTICFVDNPARALAEINRILKPRGKVIIGFVDRNSQVGRQYLRQKDKSLFYSDAVFFSTADIYSHLEQEGFIIEKTLQTLFGTLDKVKSTQPPRNGHGEGSFVVIKAGKKITGPIRFAMAVDRDNNFDIKQFCCAHSFKIYEWDNKDFSYVKELINPFRNEEENEISSRIKKGHILTRLLKKESVNVIVSSDFGDNIEMAVDNFIPVIVPSDTPAKVITVLTKHMEWIKDELQNRPGDYKLFTIRQGILKTSVHSTSKKTSNRDWPKHRGHND
ncbi:MAG: methyltransferase domain-containing protein [Bacteroidales bacterium]